MEHLIVRCAAGNKDTSTSETDNEASTNDRVTIEDQKNQVLVALSSGNFTQIVDLNVDLEVLIEILYDLLYALPHSLIPKRIADVCSYTSELDYEQVKWILDYLPRSHLRLFELITQFLGVYIRCFLCETKHVECGLSRLLADACFQIDKEHNAKRLPIISRLVMDTRIVFEKHCQSLNAVHFLNMFVSVYIKGTQ